MSDDVLILGAGPAGSTLAWRLARAGLRVRIADRADFPRSKPCGEFLSPACAGHLRELGFDDPCAQLGATPVRSMCLGGFGVTATGRFRHLPGRPDASAPGFGIRRSVLDERLLRAAEAAGARFTPRTEFLALLRDGNGRVAGAAVQNGATTTRLPARFVVGADGLHSRVARSMGVHRRVAWLDQFALTTHYATAEPHDDADVHLLPSGFAATTGVGEGIFSFNLVLPRTRFRGRTTGDWDAFVQAHVAGSERIAARLAAARRCGPWRGCGPFGHRTTTVWQPGVALVGDAAGYVDPMTGEGIYYALFGARALAGAVIAALADPDAEADALAGYAAARRRELGPRMRAASLLQRALRHPFVVRSGLRALERWPALCDLVVTLTGDTIHPRELWRPSFWRDFRRAL